MKINWKVRFKNKAWLVTFVIAIVAFVYQILGIFGVVPGVSEDTVVAIIGALVELLVMLGIVIDPTTEGVNDSSRAMNYIAPSIEKEDDI